MLRFRLWIVKKGITSKNPKYFHFWPLFPTFLFTYFGTLILKCSNPNVTSNVLSLCYLGDGRSIIFLSQFITWSRSIINTMNTIYSNILFFFHHLRYLPVKTRILQLFLQYTQTAECRGWRRARNLTDRSFFELMTTNLKWAFSLSINLTAFLSHVFSLSLQVHSLYFSKLFSLLED